MKMVPVRMLRSKTSQISIQNPSFSSSSLATEFISPIPKIKPLSSIYAARSRPTRTPATLSVAAYDGEQTNWKNGAEKRIKKKLSGEMASLLRRFHDEGYLKGANLLPDEGDFDPQTNFLNYYARNSLKIVAEKFGLAHQEAAKWLSGSCLKIVALFGCPSVDGRTVFAAKRMRSFFGIQEYDTCRACKLKTSCKFATRRVPKVEKVALSDVMRLLTVYSLNMDQHVKVPKDVIHSVRKLLRDVVNLTENTDELRI